MVILGKSWGTILNYAMSNSSERHSQAMPTFEKILVMILEGNRV
jgi:hypothetical protein